jgi:NhaA family Na+:H+ antiporter
MNTAVEQSLLLPAGAVTALIWANVAHASYERFAHALHFIVNDVGMVFFFALAAKEVVEATAPGGALSSVRRAAMPVLAALGGMIAPAGIYLAVVTLAGQPALARGWAIPCATDIAFSYLTAQFVLGGRHPGIPFLLLLAIADDAFGLVILAAFYPTGELRPREFVVLFVAAMLVAYWLRRRAVLSFWPYVIGAGLLSWVALLRGGLHPALALVPIVPFLPHAARDPGLFVGAPASAHDTLSELEHWWKKPVEGILFAFGLVNAGVPFASAGIGTWAVLIGVLAGKPLGIVGFTLLGRIGGLRLPLGLGWRELVVVGCAAAIGFTVALFFATAAFPTGPLLDQTKTGALLTAVGALLTAIVAIILRVGRFAPSVR